jgi:hypothetical protein
MRKPKYVIERRNNLYIIIDTSDASIIGEDIATLQEAIKIAEENADLIQRCEEYNPSWGPIKIVKGFGCS